MCNKFTTAFLKLIRYMLCKYDYDYLIILSVASDVTMTFNSTAVLTLSKLYDQHTDARV